MCFSKTVRASDAFILSLSSFRDTLHAAFALSASSSNLRLLGQGILASTEDCIPASKLYIASAIPQLHSQRWSALGGSWNGELVRDCEAVEEGTRPGEEAAIRPRNGTYGIC